MRFVLALGLLITLCASASAAAVHRSAPRHPHHVRAVQRVTAPPPARLVSPPARFAVPGWTDEETRQWLYNGSAAAGLYF
jgi:hypothetical protein